MPCYEYTPLDKERNEIRVLTLLPGRKRDPIEIVISHEIFSDPPPKYEALSYAWGSTEDPVSLTIREDANHQARPNRIKKSMSRLSNLLELNNSKKRLAITRNLAGALPYLRHPSLPRRLWIDAICVNQENRTERGEQVQLMGDIFKKASRVVVWLGPGDSTSAFALSTLEELGSKVAVNWSLQTIQSRPGEEPHWGDDQRSLPYSEETVGSLCSLLESPWFERLWVHQEVKLANPSAILMCGDKTIMWDCFMDAMFACRYKEWMPWDIEALFYQRVAQAYRMKRLENYIPLARLIRETQDCKCSDDRDRIYAMLSTVHPLERDLMVRPDYTLSVNEVYTQFAVRYWETQPDLNLLNYCELQDEDERPADLPSWVPRWNVRSDVVHRLVEFRASGRSDSSVRCDSVTLTATGVRGAVVREVKHFPRLGDSYHDILAVIRSLIPADALDEAAPYAGGGTIFEAYLRSFCCDTFAHREMPARADWPSFDACKTELRLAFSPQSELELELELSVNLKNYLEWVLEYSRGRAFFTTQQGHVGLCPECTRPGDVICVLLGCEAPLMLRPTIHGQYLVVGECYIQGFMYNEALLGPLPGAIEIVARRDGKSTYWDALNRETGKVGPEDPRLDSVPLPPGWRIVQHDMELYEQRFVRDDEDEEYWTVKDPRLLPEELRARGVPLETFEIV